MENNLEEFHLISLAIFTSKKMRAVKRRSCQPKIRRPLFPRRGNPGRTRGHPGVNQTKPGSRPAVAPHPPHLLHPPPHHHRHLPAGQAVTVAVAPPLPQMKG